MKETKPKLAKLLVTMFSMLALIHFFWASGGKWGFESVLPTDEGGIRMLNPNKADSIFIGVALSLCGLFYWFTFISASVRTPSLVKKIGLWVIPLIFALRALGDFKYIGFFKQVKSTEFTKLDTWFFSPLCLTIALIGFMLLYKKNESPSSI